MAEKVVVTGAAGFIGSHLCERLLSDGYEVVGVDSLLDYYDVRIKRDNLTAAAEHERFRFIEDSLNRLDLDELLDGVATVFHQAAQAGVRASWGERFEEYIDSNIRATQALLEAARRHALERFVYASSSSVYGETAELPMKESHPTRPVSPYGVTKLDGENLCLLYERSYGVPAVCLRYFTVFGPRQRPDMAFHRFIRWTLSGEPVEVYGNGSQTRDFTYVSDIVDANVAAMGYRGKRHVFNVGGGNRVSLNHVLDTIGRVTGRELDVRYQGRQRGDVTHTYADITLARDELGYSPRVGLEEGIRREFEWIETMTNRLGVERSQG
jgi:UDP-glucose 4-epimerase